MTQSAADHALLEEYESDHILPYRLHQAARPIVLSAPTPAELLRTCREAVQALGSDQAAASFTTLASAQARVIPLTHARLGFVASSAAEALTLLERAIERLEARVPAGWRPAGWKQPEDIFYRERGMPLAAGVGSSPEQNSARQLGRAVVQLRVAGLALGFIDPFSLPRDPERLEERGATTVRQNGSNHISARTLALW